MFNTRNQQLFKVKKEIKFYKIKNSNFFSSSDSKCIWRNSTDRNIRYLDKDLNKGNQSKKKLGELFDVTKQCKIAFGAHYGLCRVLEYQISL